MSDVFDLFGVEEVVEMDPRILQAIEQLALAIGGLTSFEKEPDLFMVAVAVQDILEAAGHPTGSAGAWVQYEQDYRRTTKLEEARARADALYRVDLEHLHGWSPVFKTEQSSLPWRQPGRVDTRGGAWSSQESPAVSARDSESVETTEAESS